MSNKSNKSNNRRLPDKPFIDPWRPGAMEHHSRHRSISASHVSGFGRVKNSHFSIWFPPPRSMSSACHDVVGCRIKGRKHSLPHETNQSWPTVLEKLDINLPCGAGILNYDCHQSSSTTIFEGTVGTLWGTILLPCAFTFARYLTQPARSISR